MKALVFDFDGTLVDSAPGILLSLCYALRSVGVSDDCLPQQLVPGPPLPELIKASYPSLSTSQISTATATFKSHYDSIGCTNATLFVGVESMLQKLSQYNIPTYIATNKRYIPTKIMTRSLGIDHLFAGIYAIDMPDVHFSCKSDILLRLLHDFAIPNSSLYIGDRLDDYAAASSSNLNFVFPSWGYQYEENLLPPSAPRLEINQLLNLVLKS